MALGAQTADIGVLVGRQVLAMVVGGIVAGLAAAMASAQWMRSLDVVLYGVTPSDPPSLAAAVFVALAAAIATAIPLARATQTEPAAVLRQET